MSPFPPSNGVRDLSTQSPAQVLFVDDIPELCEHMVATLASVGIQAMSVSCPSKALPEIIDGRYQLVMTTLVMSEMSGFDFIRKVRGIGCNVPIMMITGYGDEKSAIEASRLGVIDYMTKPIADDEVIARVQRVLNNLQCHGQAKPQSLSNMVSADPRMLEIFEWVKTVAPTDSKALILGQTGAGKQLLAKAIHQESQRAKEPFVEVNCAAIPENLIESELFGHEAGAFTGATSRRIGRFEQAGSGTLFLDEIAELGFSLQSKLLHVLENGIFSRVGGSETLTSKARLVSATNRDLEHEVEQGRFRADLFYRLNVMSIDLPPLSQRRGDIPLLAKHFLREFLDGRKPIPKFTKSALDVLSGYRWPGNVRELQNVVEQLAVLHRSEQIEATDLPERILRRDRAVETPSSSVPSSSVSSDLLPVDDWQSEPFREAKKSFEEAYLRQVISDSCGNLADAARKSQLDRGQFYRLAKRYGLTADGLS
ncbi:two-component system, NtrC family, response regulator/two-component system, NtrC family, nitrogen regulation response regulator NtrX [Neorhodopirellula lusitana]|uniref:Two-component system, NtrC family, response regulator/two-component system, NtrC family, nitrogen regulation response regulator NtrX n=1 Tax=Neorhodopirellula lusitana TaxID=445327 RepID=A0ABY1Q2G1_9BACT|nr:sigma-54 dependent transcriptional regulator [Neorhodopirellula lusitana]SMP56226.1 two-component system, NtrC family, response regulator/two-component system, NtrC family, nitrogen regulation response regulator NtrX [Neorhodopirellula lusitana]